MEQLTLRAEKRNLLGKKVKILRGKGQIPAVLYGRKFKPVNLVLNHANFKKIFRDAGEATLINIEMGNEKYKTLIRDIQRDPVKDEIIHVDLYKVDMSQEIQTEIPLKFAGISRAVEELEGNFITGKDSVRVECLPDKLVSEIEVDVSSLKTFEDLIHIKDLKIPEGIKVLDDVDDIVAQVTPPLSEEELKNMEEEAAASTEKAQIENIEAAAAEHAKEKLEKEAEAEAPEAGKQPKKGEAKKPEESPKNE